MEHAVYWLELARDYPQSMPTVQQTELDLHRTRNRRLQNIFLIILSTLQTVFKPGHVCIFDTLDAALPIISCLDGHRLEMDEAYYLAPNIIPEEWRWTHVDHIDMSNIAQMVECVICMEEAHAFKTMQAPCKHHFCLNCLQSKHPHCHLKNLTLTRHSRLGSRPRQRRTIHLLPPTLISPYHQSMHQYDGV